MNGRTAGPPSAARLVLRRRLFHQRDLYLTSPILALGIASVIANSNEIPGVLLLIGLLVGVQIWIQLRVYLIVSDTDVRIRDLPGPNGSAPRSSVTAIRRYSYWVAFKDQAGNTVLRSRPYWTTSQLLDVSEELGVPLYDHRRLGGFANNTSGRLVHGTTPSPPTRDGTPASAQDG